jgi:hypothetical protein
VIHSISNLFDNFSLPNGIHKTEVKVSNDDNDDVDCDNSNSNN